MDSSSPILEAQSHGEDMLVSLTDVSLSAHPMLSRDTER